MTPSTPPVAAPDYKREDFAHSPLVLFYEVTQACDLACQHCRASAHPDPSPDQLDPAESIQLLDQIASFPKPPLLVLTGGDPFKRPDLFDLIRHGTELGLRVAVTPSATPLVTTKALDQLKEAGIVRLALSLDGATADQHDLLRGVGGSFDRTLEILHAAKDRQIPLQVNTTLTRNNVGQIEAMADLISPFDIALWSVFFLIPVGRGIVLERLSDQECEDAFARLWEISRRGQFAVKSTEAPHYRRFVLQENKRVGRRDTARQTSEGIPADATPHPVVSKVLPRKTANLGVNDGKGVMFVGHRGNIFPTGFLPIECGQFPKDNVVKIYQESPTFVDLRNPDKLEGKCGECEYRNLCGGSRARSYAVTGNLFAPEPDCIYQPHG